MTVHSLDETGAQRRMGGDRFSMVVQWDEPVDEVAAEDAESDDTGDDQDMYRPRVHRRTIVVGTKILPENGNLDPHATPKKRIRAAYV